MNPSAGPAPVRPDWARAVRALRSLGPFERALELACGTGIWTRELLRISRAITAVDGAPEMLALNRAKLADPRVRYVCADLFTWEPDAEYDLIFFAFWLSHVPPPALPAFLDKVGRAVRLGGRAFLVDEPAGGRQVSGPTADGLHQTRTLRDGRRFTIVKAYYDPAAIGEQLRQRGFAPVEAVTGDAFFYLTGRRRRV